MNFTIEDPEIISLEDFHIIVDESTYMNDAGDLAIITGSDHCMVIKYNR